MLGNQSTSQVKVDYFSRRVIIFRPRLRCQKVHILYFVQNVKFSFLLPTIFVLILKSYTNKVRHDL